jgi:hypothetical protein
MGKVRHHQKHHRNRKRHPVGFRQKVLIHQLKVRFLGLQAVRPSETKEDRACGILMAENGDGILETGGIIPIGIIIRIVILAHLEAMSLTVICLR